MSVNIMAASLRSPPADAVREDASPLFIQRDYSPNLHNLSNLWYRYTTVSRKENPVSVSINELAEIIVTLTPQDQEELIKKVADLNFQRGLEALSQKYRERLAQEGKLQQPAAEVLAELDRLREEIAAYDYRA
jgi:hypothetical protein